MDTPEPPPKDHVPDWKAEFYVDMKLGIKDENQYDKVITLGDSGSNKSTISEDFYRNSPALRRRPYRTMTTRGKAINGTKVLTLGIVSVPFRINGHYMAINCRVVRGLIQPFILGWDFFSKAKAKLNTEIGQLEFRDWPPTPLVKDSSFLSGCYYRIHEDLVVPANSKMHNSVELMADKDQVRNAAKTVVTEPFANDGSDVWTCRAASQVNDCMFMTEFVNCCEYDVKLEAGRVLGYAEFRDPEEFNDQAMETEMYNSYRSDDSAYESGGSSESEGDDDVEEEIVCDPPPKATDDPPQLRSPSEPCQPQDTPPPPKEKSIRVPQGAKLLKVDYSTISKEHAVPYKEELQHLLEVEKEEVLSKHDRDYGKTSLIQLRAHIKDPSAPPIAVPPYRTRPDLQKTIDDQAFEMLADGLVCHSTSPYSAPILLAKKKFGGWRFLTDFRKVNDRCDKMVYPLPRIEDSLQKLDNPCIFSTMDLTKGFWQIPIHPEDRKYYAFSTQSLHLEYLVAPMGAKNSPSYLTALMQLVLRGLPPQHIISYLDDILVASSNMEDHLHHLRLVLTALGKAGLKLNPSKCSFAQDSVICLGHRLSKDGVSPDPANIEKIRSWKPPENVKRLKSFLGLTGYYRQFIRDYSKIAHVLTDLTKEDVDWDWTPACQEAFEFLRDTLISNKIMNYPDFSQPFIVKSDASHSAIGYVLNQTINGEEKVIAYGSKKLSNTQQNWSTYDREFFALLCAVRANAHYLRHAPFTAITDHRPLLAWKKMDAKKDPTGRRTRWTIELNTYDFELIYKQGKAHADADAMSRRGDDDDEVAEDGEDFLALLGMACEDEFSAVKLNAVEEEIDRLRIAQNDDLTISMVKSFVRTRKKIPSTFPESWYKANRRWFVMRQGILYKKAYAESIHLKVIQAVIPPSLVKTVLKDLHGSYMAGHPSAEKMLLTVKRYAVWPTIAKDIRDFVQNCKVCDQEREPVPANKSPRIPIKAKNVWDHVICDLISLPTGSMGFHYVLVFIDVFSGYVKLYKLKDKNTKGVCRAFEDLTCIIGPPRLLTSDNGGEFESELLKEMCQVKGASKRTSVSYRPQSQSPVERYNRELVRALKKRLIQYGRSWVNHLPYVEWSYNNTPRYNSKMTPYFIMYGREAPLPLYAEPEVGPTKVKDPSSKAYLEGVKKRTKEIADEARERIESRSAKDVAASNKKAKHKPLVPGEKVFERVPDGTREKLQSKWSGILKVVKRQPGPPGEVGTTYTCERPDGKLVKRNYEQLKTVRAQEDPAPEDTPPVEIPIPPAARDTPVVRKGQDLDPIVYFSARLSLSRTRLPSTPQLPQPSAAPNLPPAPNPAPHPPPPAPPPPPPPPAPGHPHPALPPASPEHGLDVQPPPPSAVAPSVAPPPTSRASALPGFTLLLDSDDSLATPHSTTAAIGDELPGSHHPQEMESGLGDAVVDSPNRAGPSGLCGSARNASEIYDISEEAEAADEASYSLPPVCPKSAPSVRNKSSKGRPPVAPSSRSLRPRKRRADPTEETAKSGLAKVRTTVETVSNRTSPRETEPDESWPDAFASFGSADLIRGNVAPLTVFDEVETGEAEQEDIKILAVPDSHDTPHAAGDTPQSASQLSSILTPFSNFFSLGRAAATPAPADTPTAKDGAESTLEDPLNLQPQTSSTPIG